MSTRFAQAVLMFLITSSAAPGWAEWSNEFGPTGLTTFGHVAAVVEFGGQLVAAGEFRTAGRDSVANIARWDGEAWLPFGNGLRSVECLTVHDGRLVAGGEFEAGDSAPADGIAFWDGQEWRAYSTPLRGEVYALAVYRGDLIVGGRFAIEGDDPIRHIARWDGQSWHPLGSGIAGGGRTRVKALETHGSELVVAGVFGCAGTTEAHNIAAWNGQKWRSLAGGADDAVNAVRSTGEFLYAAGPFRVIGGDSASCVAVWDGSSWSALDDGVRHASFGDPVVNDLEIWQDELVVAGMFDTAGGQKVWSLASWDGREWNARPSGFVDAQVRWRPEEVLDLTVFDGRLVAAGKMRGGPGYLVNGLGLWDGRRWDPLAVGQGAQGAVRDLKPIGGQVLIGSERPVGAANTQGIAVWEDDHWRSFAVGTADSIVFHAELKTLTEHQGRIVAYGRYLDGEPYLRGQRRASLRLATWDDGWQTITPPLELEHGFMHDIVSFGDSIFLLGAVADKDGETVPGVVWDGSKWSVLELPEGAIGLGCTAVVSDRLYVSWHYATEDGPARFGIAEFDGESWRIIKEGLLNQILTMVEWEGRLLASFSIPHENATETQNLQLWDGERWTPLPGEFSYRHPGDGRILQLTEYDAHLVAAGNFKGVDGLACSRLAFWDGEIWRPLDGGVDSEARLLAAAAGSLWIGGGFTRADGVHSRYLARWDGPLPVGTPIDSLPIYVPEPRPTTRRGDGWHSHALDLTHPAEPYSNGDFTAWSDSIPEHWEWRIGRKCSVESVLPHHVAGGILIEAQEDVWCMPSLAQRFSMEGGCYYRVRARYDLSWKPYGERTHACRMTIGDYRRDHNGYEYGPLHTRIGVDLEASADGVAEIVLRAGADADVGVVSIHVRAPETRLLLHEVEIDTIPMTEDDTTRMLIAELQRNLVLQSDRSVDWLELERRFTGAGAAEWQDYGELVKELLRSVQERRLILESGSADVIGSYLLHDNGPIREEDRLTRERVAAIDGRFMDWSESGADIGWAPDGIAYAKLLRSRISEEQLGDLALAEGILLDLRRFGYDNDYRSDKNLQAFAGRFTREPVVYGFMTANGGAEDTLQFEPSPDAVSGIPIICLIGQGCSGNGANLAMMLKALPNVTLVGRPSRGATAGITRYIMPVGSIVEYPARQICTADGDLVNDSRGLQPDVTVEPDGTLDPVFEEGLRILRMRLADR